MGVRVIVDLDLDKIFDVPNSHVTSFLNVSLENKVTMLDLNHDEMHIDE